MIAKLLVACASFSWWYEFALTSALFFGESQYPVENEE